MKIKPIIIAIVLTIFFCECKKENIVKIQNMWSLNGINHAVTSTTRMDIFTNEKAIVFNDNNEGKKASVYVIFNMVPMNPGTYEIVAANDVKITDNQCRVYVLDDNGYFYYYYFYENNAYLDVKFNSKKKIVLTIPKIKITFPSPSPILDLNATLQEQ